MIPKNYFTCSFYFGVKCQAFGAQSQALSLGIDYGDHESDKGDDLHSSPGTDVYYQTVTLIQKSQGMFLIY